MIDLKPIENEVRDLEKELIKKKDELSRAKENNLKEQYGEDFGCHNCAYSCCLNVDDYHTYCTEYRCIHCYPYCDKYMSDNELSIYIRDNHEYDYGILNTLNKFFDVYDIMKNPELHKKALEVLKVRDREEN